MTRSPARDRPRASVSVPQRCPSPDPAFRRRVPGQSYTDELPEFPGDRLRRETAGSWWSGRASDRTGTEADLRRSATTASARRWDRNSPSTPTPREQQNPSIAMAKDGRFVVAWEAYQDLDDHTPIPPSDIFARRFASDGTPLGDDFQVNTYTTGQQHVRAVAIDDAKEFVIVWTGRPDFSVEGRRYDAAGAPQGRRVRPQHVDGIQERRLGGHDDVRRFRRGLDRDRPGGTRIPEFRAALRRVRGARAAENSRWTPRPPGNDFRPRIAADGRGNFIVVWSASDGDFDGTFGQRFNRSAEKVGTEFPVNSYTTDEQDRAVGGDGLGRKIPRHLVELPPGRLGWRILRPDFDRSAQKIGGEMEMNITTSGDQSAPAAAFDGSGFVVVWQSQDQDGSYSGVFGRRQQLHPRGSPSTRGRRLRLRPMPTASSSRAKPSRRPRLEQRQRRHFGDVAGSSPLFFCILGSPCVAAGRPRCVLRNAPSGVLGACDDGSPDACYTVGAGGPRPGTHWDGCFSEDLSTGGGQLWTLHVGDSFTDVPRSQPFYKKIETMLHTASRPAARHAQYCPSDAGLARPDGDLHREGLAGAGEFVPTTGLLGTVSRTTARRAASRSSPTSLRRTPFCRHVHYLAAQNVTLGCGNARTARRQTITRDAMASFIAKALVAPGGGNAVPPPTDPIPRRAAPTPAPRERRTSTSPTCPSRTPSASTSTTSGRRASWTAARRPSTARRSRRPRRHGQVHRQRLRAAALRAVRTVLPRSADVDARPRDSRMKASWQVPRLDLAAALARRSRCRAQVLRLRDRSFRSTPTRRARQVYPGVSRGRGLNGGFVVVWTRRGRTASDVGVFGQRFDAVGAKAGAEFQVNTYTTGAQADPRRRDGRRGQLRRRLAGLRREDGSIRHLRPAIQRGRGASSDRSFVVNTTTTGSATEAAAIAMVPDGRFVVVWRGVATRRLRTGVRRHGREGRRRVPRDTVPVGQRVAVRRGTSIAAGGFVVVWTTRTLRTAIGDAGLRTAVRRGRREGRAPRSRSTPTRRASQGLSRDRDGPGRELRGRLAEHQARTAISTGHPRPTLQQRRGERSGRRFQVNTYTTGAQVGSVGRRSSRTAAFVVVWQSFGGTATVSPSRAALRPHRASRGSAFVIQLEYIVGQPGRPEVAASPSRVSSSRGRDMTSDGLG